MNLYRIYSKNGDFLFKCLADNAKDALLALFSDIGGAYGTEGYGTEDDYDIQEVMPDFEDVKTANKTSRSKGAVGSDPIVYRVFDSLHKGDSSVGQVCDFGAGKDAAHAIRLRNKGYSVDPIEFGDNHNPDRHRSLPYQETYSHILLSNVLNVQPTKEILRYTLEVVDCIAKAGCILYANYPTSPRKGGWAIPELLELIKEYSPNWEVERFKHPITNKNVMFRLVKQS